MAVLQFIPPDTTIEALAREVLCGFFDDLDGFKDMSKGSRRRAVNRLSKFVDSISRHNQLAIRREE